MKNNNLCRVKGYPSSGPTQQRQHGAVWTIGVEEVLYTDLIDNHGRPAHEHAQTLPLPVPNFIYKNVFS